MNKYMYLIPILLLVGVSAFSINPNNFSVNSTDNSRKYITVSNPDNSSITVDISTSCSDWILLSASSLSVNPSDSGSFYFVVSPPSYDQSKSCTIVVSNSNESYSAQVNIVAQQLNEYKYNKTKWVMPNEKLSITVEGQQYDLIINDVSDTIDYDVYLGNTKISTESLGQDDTSDTVDSVIIKVIELIPTSHRAKLQILSKDTSDIQVTMSSLGTLSAIPKSQAFLLSSLEQRQFTITFKNKFDMPIQVDSIRLDKISDGFRLEYASQDSLDPGESLPVTLNIDPYVLTVGEHVVHACMDAEYRDKSISACSEIDVTIPNSAILDYATSNIQVNMPDTILIGVPFNMNITGVNRASDISITSDKNDLIVDSKSLTAAHGLWSSKVTFARPGAHTVTFLYKGNQFATRSVDVMNLSELNIILTPKDASSGDKVTITAEDNYGNTLNVPITVDGSKTSKLLVEAGHNYTICISTSFGNKCISKIFKKPEMYASIGVLKVGDVLGPSNITVTTESGSEIENYSLYIDGNRVTAPITMKAGTHTVTVKSPGYKDYSTVISLKEPVNPILGFFALGNINYIDIIILIVILAGGYFVVKKYKQGRLSTSISNETWDKGFDVKSEQSVEAQPANDIKEGKQ